MMIIAFLLAFYEQQKPDRNVYITVGAIVVFMCGMMRLSTKIPSKNQDNKEEDVS